MFRVLILTDENERARELSSRLAEVGFSCSIASVKDGAPERAIDPTLDLVLVATNGSPANLGPLVRMAQRERHLPVIALLPKAALYSLDSSPGLDDFVVEPWEAAEVALRARRVLWETSHVDSEDLIKCGDLMIDLARCEVFINGRPALLTFKEYELLRFLASNKGRVFSREALLNRVWGYDYYGGDRTVDVHIRRLRGKIEDPAHTFIETVRNIGYKFKETA